ncbi:MAG: amidohydrolase [Pseudomonadota bacterium]
MLDVSVAPDKKNDPSAGRRVSTLAIAAGIVGLAALVTGVASAAEAPADSAYRSGYVYTVDAKDSVQQALAVRAGKIVYVGSDAGVTPFIGKDTKVTDLKGRMLMPGLVDGHMHPIAGGAGLLTCNLNYESLSVTVFQARIQACLDADQKAGPDSLLEVGHWFQYGMQPKGVEVSKKILDSLRTARPIIVRDSFGHSSLVNSRALALVKIDKNSKDPIGGSISRDAAGVPNGFLQDSAQGIVASLNPPETAADRLAGAKSALDALRRQGITSFLDAAAGEDSLTAFATIKSTGGLTARAHFAVLMRPAEATDSRSTAVAVNRVVQLAKRYDTGPLKAAPSLNVRQVKLFLDGVINAPANTAVLVEPYLENRGTPTAPRFEPSASRGPDLYYSRPVLREIITGITKAGLSPHMHTDGDGAVREALDAVEATRKSYAGMDIRPVVAHCELVHPADYPRFAALNVTPVLSFQWGKPAGDTVEGVLNSLGPRRQAIVEPSGVLAAAGARIAFGSDWPVDPLDQWFALKVGVTRTAQPGSPPEHSGRLGTDPGLPVQAVVRAATMGAAYTLGQDREIGSLEVGKLADLIVLDRNVIKIPSEEIASTHVLMTVVGGKTVFEQPVPAK